MSDPRNWLSVVPRPVAVLGPEGDVRFHNEAFGCVFGERTIDAAGVTIALHESVELDANLAGLIPRLRVVGRTGHFQFTPPGDPGRVYAVTATRAKDDEVVLLFDDVTQRNRVDAINDKARSYLEAILNQLRSGIVVLDDRFNATFLNAEQANLLQRLGVEDALFETIGLPIASTYPVLTPEEWEGVRSQVVGAREPVTWTKVPYPRDNPASYFLITVVPLTDTRMPSGAICVTDDVTRMVRLEKELIRKERLALSGQMAIALNHEINNPLMAILGSAESLLYSEALDASLSARVETIKTNAGRIADVTRRLREMEDIQLTEYYQGGPLMLDFGAPRREPPARPGARGGDETGRLTSPLKP